MRFSEILRSAEWQFCADWSGQPVAPTFKGQEIQQDVLTLYRISQNVGKELPLSAA
jgi:hypothetical protein